MGELAGVTERPDVNVPSRLRQAPVVSSRHLRRMRLQSQVAGVPLLAEGNTAAAPGGLYQVTQEGAELALAVGVETGGGLAHLFGGGIVDGFALAEEVEADVGAGGDGQAEGAAIFLGVVRADLEVVHLYLFAGAVDIDAGLDGVGRAQLVFFLLDLGVVGDLDIEDAGAGADAVDADAVLEPLGVAASPGEDGDEVALTADAADGAVDGKVEHEGLEVPAALAAAGATEGAGMARTDPPPAVDGIGQLAVAELELVVALGGLDVVDAGGGDETNVAHAVEAVGEENGKDLADTGELVAHRAEAADHAVLVVGPELAGEGLDLGDGAGDGDAVADDVGAGEVDDAADEKVLAVGLEGVVGIVAPLGPGAIEGRRTTRRLVPAGRVIDADGDGGGHGGVDEVAEEGSSYASPHALSEGLGVSIRHVSRPSAARSPRSLRGGRAGLGPRWHRAAGRG